MVTAEMIPGTGDLSEVYSVREQVFCHEQGYSLELDRDGTDPVALHVLVRVAGEPAGTGRLYPDGEGRWHVGRISVLKEHRGKHIGDLVMRMLLMSALEFQADEVLLGSQIHAIGFYASLGFEECGERYLDEGDPHQPMRIGKAAMEKLFAGCAGCKGGAE